MEVISAKTIKKIFLECGVGHKYASQAVDVFDCLALSLTGKNLAATDDEEGVHCLALPLENPGEINLEGFKSVHQANIYEIVPYTDALIRDVLKRRYGKYQIWIVEN